MLSLIFCSLSAFLALRQIVILFYGKKISLFSLILSVFFTVLFFLFLPYAQTSFALKPFLWTAGALSCWLAFDLYRLNSKTFRFSKLRWLTGSLFSVFALFLVLSLSLPHLFTSTPILHIHMTGEQKQQVVTWKTPAGPLKTETLITYHVKVQDMQGVSLFDEYLYGDLATIRLRMISFPFWMQWLGFPHLWNAEAISSDYFSLLHKKNHPSETFFLNAQTQSPWRRFAWSFWEKVFFYEGHPFFISHCSLMSSHIPLLDRKGQPIKGSFTLRLSADSKAPILAKEEVLNLRAK